MQQLNSQFVNACKTGDIDTVKTLIEQKANINTIAIIGGIEENGLEWAVYYSNETLVKLLLEEKADPNLNLNTESEPRTVLSWATNTNITKLLLEAKADANYGKSLISHTENNRESIRLLLDAKANPNIKTSDDKSILDILDWREQDKIQYFIAAGLNLSTQDYRGNTPLLNAIRHYYEYSNPTETLDSIKLACDNMNVASINMQNLDGLTALMLAIKEESVDIVKLLLEYKNDFDITDKKGNTVFDHCASMGNQHCRKEIARLLASGYRKFIEDKIKRNTQTEIMLMLCINDKVPNELAVNIIESV